MSRWDYCPRCDHKLTYTEIQTGTKFYNGSDYEYHHEDVAWCEKCWEKDQSGEITGEELYDAYQLDNDIKQMKEDR
jgi:hypothetical protein